MAAMPVVVLAVPIVAMAGLRTILVKLLVRLAERLVNVTVLAVIIEAAIMGLVMNLIQRLVEALMRAAGADVFAHDIVVVSAIVAVAVVAAIAAVAVAVAASVVVSAPVMRQRRHGRAGKKEGSRPDQHFEHGCHLLGDPTVARLSGCGNSLQRG